MPALRGSSDLAAVIAIRGATLIDGTGAPPVPNSLLVVSGGRIVYKNGQPVRAAER
ncbi:MAG: hypothetical protein WEB59_10580 [Thermoanaerobaculia bacterium]